MFGKSKGDAAEKDGNIGSAQELQRSTATPGASEAISSISSGLSIVGKIIGHGAVTIFGHVEGELHASTVVIAEGGKVEGDIVAEELKISGRAEGTIHANRVQLNSTAVVAGDIFHRSLAVEENAQFEGASRRLKDAIDTSSRVQANRNQPQTASIDISAGSNGSQSRIDRRQQRAQFHERWSKRASNSMPFSCPLGSLTRVQSVSAFTPKRTFAGGGWMSASANSQKSALPTKPEIPGAFGRLPCAHW